MDLLVVLLAAALFPVGCLGFVLWMARIEDSLPDAVRRATRTPDPLPVLAIPVRRTVPAQIPVVPAQRSAPVETPVASALAPAVEPAPAPAVTPTGT